MIDYREELNSEQYRVVTADAGPLLVIAGAGSGKTRALTYRTAWLIEQGVRPDRILLVTFTNKAARSMLTRVESLVGDRAGMVWGGTFHHIGNRILRRHARRVGYDGNYSILDREDARQLVASAVVESGIPSRGKRFPTAAVLMDMISLAANTDTSLETIVRKRYPGAFTFMTDILKVAFRYRIRKQELNVMDFDDLLLKWRDLLVEHEDVHAEYARTFEHILVDEYQDTNRIQADILNLTASHHGNIMVVGDDSQSIYSFRGADCTNIMTFPEMWKKARVFKLETNYRSTPPILKLANLSIVNNREQYQKKLRAVRKGGARPVYAPLSDGMHQADFVAQRILEMADEGIPLDEMAVLYRAHFHSMELQMELVRRDIPFVVRSGIRFFEQAHVKDVTAFMRIAVNPFDEPAWKRLLVLYGGIGKVRADAIWRLIADSDDPRRRIFSDDLEAGLSKAVEPGLMEFRTILDDVFKTAGFDDPRRVIDRVLAGGYRRFLRERYDNYQSREEDLKQLAAFSRQFESLEAFLSELALMTGLNEDDDASRRREQAEQKVILSTIHQAKGLEWSVVFMIRCSEGAMPLERALKEPGGVDEERRLFYVAATRAKDQLYLCHTLVDSGRGGWGRRLSPSRFINELAPARLPAKERPFEQWIVE
ncbi:MAG: UvrD-helicase domain-containing protein [Syntrophales bacterium]|jgi:DNA helicase-2/ATP-dependent DNA helicase PcrA|nr:UvrD-helicase domain-containing protein [Syntrophales bacterium]MCK9527462.1 UvrD-helicase domain-containing protein [Syntrophales bacterium]MDX9921566.1 UvrD-helicase domain-containing protein [Syntrophales bacterium]